MIEEKNLFIVFTPYQLVNASTIAVQENLKNTEILILEGYFGLENINMQFLNTIFDKISVLKKRKNSKLENINSFKKINNMLSDYQNRNELKKYKNKYSNIFASSEANLIIQIIIKMNPEAKYNHFEDGSIDYVSSNEKTTIKRIMRQKILMLLISKFRYSYSITHQPGVFSRVEAVYALYPQFLREEIKCQSKIPIDREIFRNTLQKVFFGNQKIENSLILCLDNSEAIGTEQIKKIKSLLDELLKKDIKIYFKYHPRETRRYLKSQYLENIEEIDKNQPIEKIIADSKETVVVANASSSTHVTTFLVGSEKIISINKLMGVKNNEDYKRYFEMLENKLGIFFPKTIEGLVKEIKNEN